MDVSVECSVYKNLYNCGQMGFFASQNTSKSMSAGASPQTPLGSLGLLCPSPRLPSFNGAASCTRRSTGRRGKDQGGTERGERKEKKMGKE